MHLHRIVLHGRLHLPHLPAAGEAWPSELLCSQLYILNTMLSTATSVFGKLASRDGVGFFELTFFRNVVLLVLTIPLLVAGHVNPLNHRLDWPFALLMLRGLFGFAAISTWYWSLALMPLSDATALSFLSPALVAVLAPLVLREKTPPGTTVTLPLCLLGMLLISRPSWLFGAAAGAGGMTALGALFSTGSKLTIRALSSHNEPLSDSAMTIPQTPRCWGYLAGLSLIGYSVQILFTVAMQKTPAARAAMIDYSSLLFTLVADALVFGTYPTLLSLLGAGIIAASSLASVLLARRPADAEREAGRSAQQLLDGKANGAAAKQAAAAMQLAKVKRYDEVCSADAEHEACGLLGAVDGGATGQCDGEPGGACVLADQGAQNQRQEPAAAAEEEWKLGTELEEVSTAVVTTRTSSEKEGLLQRASR
eukprot:scaffold3.g6726.t1